MKTLLPALGKSSILHFVLGGLLVASVHFSPPPVPKPQELSAPLIEAVSVDKAALEKQINDIQKAKDRAKAKEEKRIKDLERRAREADAARRKEEKRVRDLKKQQAEAKKAAAAAKKKQQQEQEKARKLEEQRKRKEAEKKKAEKAAKEAAAKRKKEEQALKEQERKRKEAQEKAEQERIMAEQLQAEQTARQRSRQKQVLSETQKYQALIRQTIERNWITDDSMRKKPCRLNIRLASNGLVLSVKKLSGDDVVCRSVESAVLKAGTLPVSSDPAVFDKLKNINLTVEKQ